MDYDDIVGIKKDLYEVERILKRIHEVLDNEEGLLLDIDPTYGSDVGYEAAKEAKAIEGKARDE